MFDVFVKYDSVGFNIKDLEFLESRQEVLKLEHLYRQSNLNFQFLKDRFIL